MRMSWLVPVIIFSCSRFVNAASFDEVVQKAVSTGETSSFKTEVADHMGIERNLPYHALEIEDANGFHDFSVILKDNKPICVIVSLSTDTATEIRSTVFRVNLTGKLERSFTDLGRYDAEYKIIRGSGVSSDQKLTKEVRAAFRHELDFWLKGMYRKPAAGAAANVTPTR